MLNAPPPPEAAKWHFFELLHFAMENGVGKPTPKVQDQDQNLSWVTKSLTDALAELGGSVLTEQTVLNWRNGTSVPHNQKEGAVLRVLADPEPEPGRTEWRKAFIETRNADKKIGKNVRREAYSIWRDQREGKYQANMRSILIRQALGREREILKEEEATRARDNAALLTRSNYIPEIVNSLEDVNRLEEEEELEEASKVLDKLERDLGSEANSALQVLEGMAWIKLARGKNFVRQGNSSEDVGVAFAFYKRGYDTFVNVAQESPRGLSEIISASLQNARDALHNCVNAAGSQRSISLIKEAISHGVFVRKSTWQNLFLNASRWEEALKLMAETRSMGIEADVVMFSTLMSAAGTFDQAESVFKMMGDAEPRVVPDVVTFTTRMSKAESFDQAESVFKMMGDAEPRVVPNIYTFNTWMSKAESFDQAESVFKMMGDAEPRVVPNIYTFNTWMSKAESFDQAESVFKMMGDAEPRVVPDVVTFTTRMSKAESFDQAESVFKMMGDAEPRVVPDVVTFTTWMSKAESFDQAESVFKMMGDAEPRVVPNIYMFNTWMSKAESFDQAESVFKMMGDAEPRVVPNIYMFNTWMSKAESFDQAESVFKTMGDAEPRVVPDVVKFNRWMSKAESFDQAESVFKMMRDAEPRVVPDIYTFNTWMSKAESFDQAESVFKTMGDAEPRVVPDIYTFSILINKADIYLKAAKHYRQMKRLGVAPTLITYSTLVRKAPDFDQGYVHFREMVRQGIRPNARVVQTLMIKTKSYTINLDLYRGMRDKMNLQPDTIAYNRLIWLAPDANTALGHLHEMQADGVRHNRRTLDALAQHGLWDVVSALENQKNSDGA